MPKSPIEFYKELQPGVSCAVGNYGKYWQYPWDRVAKRLAVWSLDEDDYPQQREALIRAISR